MTQNTPRTGGAHHVGLTVPDLVAAVAFFVDGLGFTEVGEQPDYPAVFVSDGQLMITLWLAEDPMHAIPFDRRRNVGLHHLALCVANGVSLDSVHQELAARDDVLIEFAPQAIGGSAMRHMMCAIPGGIRLEIIDPAA